MLLLILCAKLMLIVCCNADCANGVCLSVPSVVVVVVVVYLSLFLS